LKPIFFPKEEKKAYGKQKVPPPPPLTHTPPSQIWST